MRTIILLIVCICLTAALGNLSALHFARWNTSLGSFTAELYDDMVPITANNFIDLANSGFYNDLIFHRVIDGFVIQDGCPYGTGYGGPGYTIPDEIHPDLLHDSAGVLAMAKTSAPNSAGSQYYITLAPQPNLDGNYAVFGKVVEGLDTVMTIGSVPTDANDRPITPVNIYTVSILDLAIGNITPPVDETYICNVNETQMFIIEATSENLTNDYTWYIDGIEQANSMDFIFECSFTNPGTHEVMCSVANSDWSHDVQWQVSAQGSPIDEQIQIPRQILTITPNPFVNQAKISVSSLEPDIYDIVIYDIRGRVVKQETQCLKSGCTWTWNPVLQDKKLPDGVYIIEARSSRTSIVKRCLLY